MEIDYVHGPEPASSSWVDSYGWASTSDGNGLVVTFLDGTSCLYDLDDSYFFLMLSADSKGQFVHQYLYHLPYTIVS